MSFFFVFSILYADIVNFTPLSEKLTASELFSTLNDLFGRFYQITSEKTSSIYIGSKHLPLNKNMKRQGEYK